MQYPQQCSGANGVSDVHCHSQRTYRNLVPQQLYVAVNDATTTTPGVRVFDTVTDRDLIPGPLNVGQLPPARVLFLE
jgi:hypothetical protein